MNLVEVNNNLSVGLKSDGIKCSVRKSRDRVFTAEEWIKFFRFLRFKRQKITFDFLINTGARINEARHVKVKDVNFEQKIVTIRVIKRKNLFADGRLRQIPISLSFSKRLLKYITEEKLDSEDYLNLLSTPAANICMKKTLKEAGIDDYYMFSIHNIRKTLENWLMGMNVSLTKLMLHFGHDSNTARKHYLFSENLILLQSDRHKIRSIIGNLYYNDGNIDELYDRIRMLEKKLEEKQYARY